MARPWTVDLQTAVFLVFEAQTFELAMAQEVLADVLEALARSGPHARDRRAPLRQVENLRVDATAEMRAALEALDPDRAQFRSNVEAMHCSAH